MHHLPTTVKLSSYNALPSPTSIFPISLIHHGRTISVTESVKHSQLATLPTDLGSNTEVLLPARVLIYSLSMRLNAAGVLGVTSQTGFLQYIFLSYGLLVRTPRRALRLVLLHGRQNDSL